MVKQRKLKNSYSLYTVDSYDIIGVMSFWVFPINDDVNMFISY